MATTFRESQLYFTFPREWRVVAYDQHRFYQSLSGRGMVGADFIGFLPNGDLLVLEVKNYTDPYHDRQLATVPGFITDPERYLRRMARKLTDTLRSIRIFEAFLLRKWTYRMLRPHFDRLAWLFPDWARWHRAASLLDQPERIWYVLWLETPEPLGGYSTKTLDRHKIDLERDLQRTLQKIGVRVVVAWTARRPPFLDGVEVRTTAEVDD